MKMIRIQLISAIFLLVILGKTAAEQVNHIIVFYDGKTEVTFIDSMDQENVYCKAEDTRDTSYALNGVYFIYNDFGKMFYISPSIITRMDYIELYGGTLFSVDQDTILYKTIAFNRNMRNEMVYVTTMADSFIAIPLLEVYRIDTDLAFMEQSVKKGFYTAIGGVLVTTTFQIFSDFFSQRESGTTLKENFGLISSIVWDQGNDLLPKVSQAGLKENGPTYQSLTFITPLCTIGWMVYDYYFERKSNYFRPLTATSGYPKSMQIVSFTSMVKNLINR